MSTYSNWREDLIEVIDTPTTEKKAEKKIKETKVNNKVVINPTFKESVAAMGGEILEVAEVDDKKGTSEDPQIKSKEKRAGMIKRQVLLKKLQAVRAGGGADITAGYEPEGELIEASAVLDANTKIQKKEDRKKKEAELRRLLNHAIAVKKGRAESVEPEGEMVEGKGYQPEIEHSKLGDAKKKKDKERESKLPPHLQGDAIGKMKKAFASEGIMKMVKKVIRSKKPAKKATMDPTTDKLHDWRQKNSKEQQDREKYVSPFRPIVKEADDKAYKYVVSKLKKQYGDGVLTKGDKIKPLTPEQKKKNAEIMAKRAKQDGRDATEKASDGRYSDRYSNRGSD